jgi:hypothetical protein
MFDLAKDVVRQAYVDALARNCLLHAKSVSLQSWFEYARNVCHMDLMGWDGSYEELIRRIASHFGIPDADVGPLQVVLQQLAARLVEGWVSIETDPVDGKLLLWAGPGGPCGLKWTDTFEMPGSVAIGSAPLSEVAKANGVNREKWFPCHPAGAAALFEQGCSPAWSALNLAYPGGMSAANIIGFSHGGAFVPAVDWPTVGFQERGAGAFFAARAAFAVALARGCPWAVQRLHAAKQDQVPWPSPFCNEPGLTHDAYLADGGCMDWVVNVLVSALNFSKAHIPACT